MRFRYIAYSLQGGILQGNLEAATPQEARAEIVRQGNKPLRIASARRPLTLEDLLPSLFQVKTGEVVRFARQLATMLGSGSTLVGTLEMLQGETRNRILRRTIGAIREALDQGGSLSAALAQHPKIFSRLFVSVVEAGEYTGSLAPAMEQMADILEREHEARQKAMSAMMYPVAIMGLSVATLFVLMTVALPPLLKVFEQMETDIPLMTRIAIGGAGMVKANMLKIPVVIVVGAVAFVLLRRLPPVRYWLDGVRARAPVLGSMTVSSELARFSRTVSLLLTAGVPLSTALHLGLAGCNNMLIQRAFADAEEALLSGQRVAEALKRHPILPTMFVQLVTVGEESNALKRTLGDAANTYQKQHERQLAGMLSLLEPASTVIVGGIVGFIAMSMMAPIYSAMNAIK